MPWSVERADGSALLTNATLASATVAVDCSSVGGLEWNATYVCAPLLLSNQRTCRLTLHGHRSRTFYGTVDEGAITDPTYPSASKPVTNSSSTLFLPVTITSRSAASSSVSNDSSVALTSPLSLRLPLAIYPSLFNSPSTDPPRVNATVGEPFTLDLVRNLADAVQAGSTVQMTVVYAPEQAGQWLRFNRTSGVVGVYDRSLAAASNSTDFVYAADSGLRKRAVDGEGQAVVPSDLAYDQVEITLTAEDALTSARSHERTTVNLSTASPSTGNSGGGGGGLSSKGKTILGAVLGSVLGAILLALLLFCCCRRRRRRARDEAAAKRARTEKASTGPDGGWFDPDDEDEDVDLRSDGGSIGGNGDQRPIISGPLPPGALGRPEVKRSSTTTLSRFRDFFVGSGNNSNAEPRDRSRMVSTHKASLSSGRASGVSRPLPAATAFSPRTSDENGYWSAREEQLSVEPPLTPVLYAEHTRPGQTPGSTPGYEQDGRRSSVSSMDQTPPTPGRGQQVTAAGAALGVATAASGGGWGQRPLFPFLRHDPVIRSAPPDGGVNAGTAGTANGGRSGHQTHQSLASWESASTYDWNNPPAPAAFDTAASSDKQPSSGSLPSHYSAGRDALRDEEATPAGGLPFSLTRADGSGSFPDLGPVVLSAEGTEEDHSQSAIISRASRVPATQATKVRVTSTGSTTPSPPAVDDDVVPDARTVRHSVPPAQAVQQFEHPAPLPFSPQSAAQAGSGPAFMEYQAQTSDGSLAAHGVGSHGQLLHTRRTPAGDVADFGLTDDSSDSGGHGAAADDSFAAYTHQGADAGTSLVSPLASLARTPSANSRLPTRPARAVTTNRRVSGSTAGLTPPRPLEPATSLHSGHSSAGSPKLSFRTSDDSVVWHAYTGEGFSFRPVDDAAAAHRGGVLRAVATGPEGKGEKALPRWLTFDRGMFEGIPAEGDEGRLELKIVRRRPWLSTPSSNVTDPGFHLPLPQTETGPSPDSGLFEERTVGHFSLEVRPGSQIPRRSTRAGNPRDRVVSSSGLVGQWH